MSEPIYRIDVFRVPEAARESFLRRVEETHAILRGCDGFIHDAILERCDGEGQFNLVTSVAWSGKEAMDGAKAAVLAARKATGFNPQDFMTQYAITADFGLYRPLSTAH